jgi:hypothetical protein
LLQFGNQFFRSGALFVLTVRSVQTATPGRHLDGRGLYLEVSQDGKTKRWLYRFTSPVTHRPTEAGGIGIFPETSLADARAKADEYRSLVKQGIDPIVAKREKRAARIALQKSATTFDDALRAYVDAFADKGAAIFELDALVRRHVAALLPRPLASIATSDVLSALAPVQTRLPKTAARVRAATSVVFGYALARDMFTGSNPASREVFKFLLPAPPTSTPHRMCPIDDVPATLASTTCASGNPTKALNISTRRFGRARTILPSPICMAARRRPISG